jgi:LacI family transcriptional regulator
MALNPPPGRNHGRPASRRDVAALAGVAPGTVSLVLNGTPGIRVSPETRKRIEDAAQVLAYQSSQTANALATGRTDAIGVVLNYVQQPFQDYVSGLMDGLWETLSPRGLRLVLAGGTPEHRAAGLFNRRSVDGIVFIAPPAEADPELDTIAAARFPAICIGSRPAHPGLACVDIDNAAAGRQATNALIDAGHRRILHLAGPLSVNSSARERLAGYRSALAVAGIPEDPVLIHDCSYNGAFAVDAVARILDSGTRFTAIFAGNSDMGRGAVTTLVRRGLRVPADVSVISIDQDFRARWQGPELTCLAQPLREIGQIAGQRILGMIAGAEPTSGMQLLPCQLIAGATMAPPQGGG